MQRPTQWPSFSGRKGEVGPASTERQPWGRVLGGRGHCPLGGGQSQTQREVQSRCGLHAREADLGRPSVLIGGQSSSVAGRGLAAYQRGDLPAQCPVTAGCWGGARGLCSERGRAWERRGRERAWGSPAAPGRLGGSGQRPAEVPSSHVQVIETPAKRPPAEIRSCRFGLGAAVRASVAKAGAPARPHPGPDLSRARAATQAAGEASPRC